MVMKYIDLEIGSQEWLDYRKTKIGASQSASILGICPFRSILDVFEEKVNGKTFFVNNAMKRGLEREIEARKYAETVFEIPFEPKMVENNLYPWKFATLDCFSPFDKTIIEIKWANKKVHDLAKKGKVVDYYYVQCQSQMICAEVEEMWFLSCFQEEGQHIEFVLVKVEKDEVVVQKILEEEKAFYDNHLIPKIPPAQTIDKHEMIEDDLIFDMLCEEDLDLLQQTTYLKGKIEKIENRRKEIKEDIKELGGGKSLKSLQYRFTEVTIKGKIDYETIPELQEIDLEKYRKPNSVYYKVSKA